MIEILNNYAGTGGNRSNWDLVNEEIQVTAVELNPLLAKVYQERFPNDKVVVGDAHEYLLQNFKRFDFIWNSFPCQTHSSMRQNLAVRFRGTPPVYPDLGLYQEIILLKYNCKSPWVCENVLPYYLPDINESDCQIIKPTAKIGRHLFWSNFEIPDFKVETDNLRSAQILDLQKHHNLDLSAYRIPNKRQVLRNCVNSKLGLHILETALEARLCRV